MRVDAGLRTAANATRFRTARAAHRARLWTTRSYPQTPGSRCGASARGRTLLRCESSSASRNGAATCDVAVSAPAPVPLSAFAAELARTVGARPGGAIWSGEMPLADTTALGGAGLRTGAVLNFGGPHRALAAPSVLSLHQVGGPDAGRIVPIGAGRIVIGRDPGCDLVLSDADVSRRHTVLEVSAGAITVRDCGSSNGTCVEGRRVGSDGARLRSGEVLRVGDSSLAVAGPSQTPAAVAVTLEGTLRVLRPPRQLRPVAVPDIDVPTRSSAARPRGVQWVTALLPAAAGGAIAWATNSPQFLLFALLSPLMMLSSSLGDRLHWRRSRRREAASYVRRRAAADREIEAALRHETYLRRLRYPDPAAVVRLVELPGSRLWERRRSDDDLLHVSVGTADVASTVRMRRDATVESAGTVHAVPLPVDLRCGPLGLTGPRERVAGTARWLVGQLAVLHSPADLEISALLAGAGVGRWDWLRWLPHLRGRVGRDEAEWNALVAELAAVVDQRHGRRRGSGAWSGPWHVVLIDDAARLGGVSGLAGILERGAEVGVTALCLDDATGLPAACATVVQVDGDSGTRARVYGCGAPAQPVGSEPPAVLVDAVSLQWADAHGARIGRLGRRRRRGFGHGPRFVHPARHVGSRPARAGRRRARADPAVRERGASAVVAGRRRRGDRARTRRRRPARGRPGRRRAARPDRRHDRIAGSRNCCRAWSPGSPRTTPPPTSTSCSSTTRAARHSPTARGCRTRAAMVTDLDAYLTERALRSLRSELRRREGLFAAAEVTDLAGYRRSAPARALARLIIVVDEFAALADELPDFVRGLVGVAQRGRSLGVHLVLATQRPGSAVSPEIRANTSLRIALRTTDPGESSDVVDSPDAATIERSRPGPRLPSRRRGTHVLPDRARGVADRCRPPTSWSRPSAPGVDRSPSPGTHGAAELSVLVAALRAAAAGSGYPPTERPWLPPLPDRLARSALPPPADVAACRRRTGRPARRTAPAEPRARSRLRSVPAHRRRAAVGPHERAVVAADGCGRALRTRPARRLRCRRRWCPQFGRRRPAPLRHRARPRRARLGRDPVAPPRTDLRGDEPGSRNSRMCAAAVEPPARRRMGLADRGPARRRGARVRRLARHPVAPRPVHCADHRRHRRSCGTRPAAGHGLRAEDRAQPGRPQRLRAGQYLATGAAGRPAARARAARQRRRHASGGARRRLAGPGRRGRARCRPWRAHPPGSGTAPRPDAVRLRPLPRHVPLSALPRSRATRGRLALGTGRRPRRARAHRPVRRRRPRPRRRAAAVGPQHGAVQPPHPGRRGGRAHRGRGRVAVAAAHAGRRARGPGRRPGRDRPRARAGAARAGRCCWSTTAKASSTTPSGDALTEWVRHARRARSRRSSRAGPTTSPRPIAGWARRCGGPAADCCCAPARSTARSSACGCPALDAGAARARGPRR